MTTLAWKGEKLLKKVFDKWKSMNVNFLIMQTKIEFLFYKSFLVLLDINKLTQSELHKKLIFKFTLKIWLISKFIHLTKKNQ